jgi:hypothetical protein
MLVVFHKSRQNADVVKLLDVDKLNDQQSKLNLTGIGLEAFANIH